MLWRTPRAERYWICFGKAASQPDRSRRLFQFRGPPFQSICDYCGAPTWFERGVGDGIAFTISILSL
jgi:hypothetical protein